MYKIELPGCLTTIFIFLITLYLLKELWWFIVGIFVIALTLYYGYYIYISLKEKQKEKEKAYSPQMGEVYKICPYCNTKVKVTATTCPYCNRALN